MLLLAIFECIFYVIANCLRRQFPEDFCDTYHINCSIKHLHHLLNLPIKKVSYCISLHNLIFPDNKISHVNWLITMVYKQDQISWENSPQLSWNPSFYKSRPNRKLYDMSLVDCLLRRSFDLKLSKKTGKLWLKTKNFGHYFKSQATSEKSEKNQEIMSTLLVMLIIKIKLVWCVYNIFYCLFWFL